MTAQDRLPSLRAVRTMATTTPAAMSVKTNVIPVPMLNAAPELKITRNCSTPGSTTSGGSPSSVRSTTVLVARSAA